MEKYIAVEGFEYTCKFGGVAEIISPPSEKVKIMENKVYKGNIQIKITNSNAGGAAGNASGTGNLKTTAEKNKVEGEYVVREGDKAEITVSGVTPDGSPVTSIEEFEITKSGQNFIMVE